MQKLFQSRPVIFQVFTISILLASCQASPEKAKKSSTSDAIEIKESHTLPSGFHDSIHIQQNPQIFYSLYIPARKHSRDLPVIIFYDAHGRAYLPVRKYRSIAEQLEVILVGLYNSENRQSLEYSQQLTHTILTELFTKYPIDKKNVYVSGFSGGARVSVALALSRPDIAGVIACAAANPGQVNVINRWLSMSFVTGIYDFNYLDVYSFSGTLEQQGFNNMVLEFQGGHQWPPEQVMQYAILHVLTEQHCKKSIPEPVFKNAYQNLIKAFQRNLNSRNADSLSFYYTLISKSFSFCNYFDKKHLETPAFRLKKYIRQKDSIRNAILLKENELRKYYLESLEKQSLDWWQQEIHQLEENQMLSSSTLSIHMYKRLLNLLSLVCNMKASEYIRMEKPEKAAFYLNLYARVDADNPDVYYLKALNDAIVNRADKVKENLATATRLGFNDFKRIKSEKLFSSYQAESWFADIVRDVTENFTNFYKNPE